MRGRGFAVPVLWAGCAPARDVRASVWLTLPLRACRIHLRAVLMLPGWCGGIAWGYAMQQASSTTSASPHPLPCSQYSCLPRKPNTPPCGRVNTLAIMRRKRDPMSSVHLPTRRTILTLGLTATTITLSGCAPSTRTKEKPSPSYPSPTQSFVREPEYGYGYDGIIRLDNYEKSGKYTPATHDHKALNVPKPLKPEYINEYSHDGICAFLAYWIESTNYAYLTGDLKPLSQITDPYKIIHPEILKMYEDNTGWVIGPQHIYTLELVTPASGNDFKDSTIYEWQSVLRVSPEATVYVTANKSEKLFTDFIGAREKADISSDVRYTDGEWHLVNDDGSNSYKKPL